MPLDVVRLTEEQKYPFNNFLRLCPPEDMHEGNPKLDEHWQEAVKNYGFVTCITGKPGTKIAFLTRWREFANKCEIAPPRYKERTKYKSKKSHVERLCVAASYKEPTVKFRQAEVAADDYWDWRTELIERRELERLRKVQPN